jgi:hypothetical protein
MDTEHYSHIYKKKYSIEKKGNLKIEATPLADGVT